MQVELCDNCQERIAEHEISVKTRKTSDTDDSLTCGTEHCESWCGKCVDNEFPNGNITTEIVRLGTGWGSDIGCYHSSSFYAYVGELVS